MALALVPYLQSLHLSLIECGVGSRRGKIVINHDDFTSTTDASFKDGNDGADSSGGELLAKYPHDSSGGNKIAFRKQLPVFIGLFTLRRVAIPA